MNSIKEITLKRELKQLQPRQFECCPGHDKWPCETYKNNRSKKQRSKDKKREHKYIRTLAKRILRKEVYE